MRHPKRRGMDTTAWVGPGGARRLCRSCTGHAPAGEPLESLVAQRDAGLAQPLGRSDALASQAADETALIRCHCLAHGQRTFRGLEAVFPRACARGMSGLHAVCAQDAHARQAPMSAAERVASPPRSSAPGMADRKTWRRQQRAERHGEPTRSVGNALTSGLHHGATLTQV